MAFIRSNGDRDCREMLSGSGCGLANRSRDKLRPGNRPFDPDSTGRNLDHFNSDGRSGEEILSISLSARRAHMTISSASPFAAEETLTVLIPPPSPDENDTRRVSLKSTSDTVRPLDTCPAAPVEPRMFERKINVEGIDDASGEEKSRFLNVSTLVGARVIGGSLAPSTTAGADGAVVLAPGASISAVTDAASGTCGGQNVE
jgi:hypothetical protein